jgi:predicted transcriptional regulator
MINELQCRAARSWLGLSQEDLAALAKVSARTIAHFEAGNRVPHDRTLRDLQRALEEMGIEFIFEGNVGIGIRASRAAATAAKGQAKKRSQ